MPRILTTGAQIVCPHGGLGTTTPSILKWQINGGYVAVENDVGVLACPLLIFPCVGYQLRSMGLNASQIDGRKVILETDFNQSFTGLPLFMLDTHTVFDNSTPAPIPPGQSAPPLPPELADAVAPVVVPAFQSLPFVSASLPPPLVVTFTMTGAFPNLWVLTLVSRSKKQSFDLTNGIPAQVDVSPPGGQWQTPSLTITVTLSPLFLAGLGMGIQDLYMTAVSRRGLSTYGWTMITVS